ncbi:MAG: OmpH family outer membrane protein [Sphingomonadaceae bacterium]
MRNLLPALVAAFLVAAPAAVSAQQLSPAVIVLVDLDRVVNESAAGKAAATELQARANALNTRRNTLATQLQADVQAIQQGQQNNTLVGAQLEQRLKAFQEKEEAANQELARGQEELGRAQNYVVQQINNAAQPIITQIMRERGAQIALNERATLQHSNALNVTNDVIARLNSALPKVSTTPPPPQQQPQQPRP